MREITALAAAANYFASELEVRPEIHLDDHIFGFLVGNPTFLKTEDAVQYYFHDGRDSAVRFKSLVDRLMPDHGRLRVLEFAAGYGCVSRHLPSTCPDLDFVACDIHESAVEFNAGKLGVASIPSTTVPEEFTPGSFDIVFALSFFSHMPKETWGRWLNALGGSLRPGGMLIFTTHGDTSAQKHFASPDLDSDGFWFRAESEQKDLDSSVYGQAIVNESYVRGVARRMVGYELVEYLPGHWWGHQDCYVMFRRGSGASERPRTTAARRLGQRILGSKRGGLRVPA